ncbi:MAG: hypothetical protein H0T15_00395 [Thermoleophilaceae bacterium]|nr:hypothetical protein [Thermoleophilaceae bacterium]
MVYAGIEVGPRYAHLCVLEEVRAEEPPVRLHASFYEPGDPDEVAGAVGALEEAVIAIDSPSSRPREGRETRVCDAELADRGVAPRLPLDSGMGLFEALADRGRFHPGGAGPQGDVEDGAFGAGAVFETNVEAVFCALHERRVPARRHPLGVARRIEELEDDHVEDGDAGLWARRIEEIEAAAAALCAHRFAVAHARWLGDPGEGVIVLPGSGPLGRFSTEGVVPAVERLPLR